MNKTAMKWWAAAAGVMASLVYLADGVMMWPFSYPQWSVWYQDGGFTWVARAAWPLCIYGLLVVVWYGVLCVWEAKRPLLWAGGVPAAVAAGMSAWGYYTFQRDTSGMDWLRGAPVYDWLRCGFAALGVVAGVLGLWLLLWMMERYPKIVNRSTILYLVFGVMTTGVDFGVYTLCTRHLLRLPERWGIDWNVQVGTTIAWLAAVLAAWLTNRVWVFGSRARGARELAREGVKFFAARVVTLLMSMGIMWLGVNAMGLPDLPVKAVSLVFVLVANYIASKVAVFRRTADGGQ